MKDFTAFAVLGSAVIYIAGLQCFATDDLQRLPKPEWHVGDEWIVQTNVRRQLPQPEITKREKAALEKNGEIGEKIWAKWKQDIKPKGIAITDWQKTNEFAEWAKENKLDLPLGSDGPYEPWMTSTEDWMSLDGKELWCRWQFSVVAQEPQQAKSCFKLKVSFDSFIGITDDEAKASVWLRRPKSYFLLWFRETDRTLARFEEHSVDGDILKRHVDYDLPASRCTDPSGQEDFDPFYTAMPFYFPDLRTREFDPAKEERVTHSVAQRVDFLPSRVVITIADEISTIDRLSRTDEREHLLPYERQFWRDFLPWWEEAYSSRYGGIRAKLVSVNGKDVPVNQGLIWGH